MPINQKRLKALTPNHIRATARDLAPNEVHNWYTEIEGKRFPVLQLIRAAATRLVIDAPPLQEGTTTHETIAVLSHNGFTSHNMAWH